MLATFYHNTQCWHSSVWLAKKKGIINEMYRKSSDNTKASFQFFFFTFSSFFVNFFSHYFFYIFYSHKIMVVLRTLWCQPILQMRAKIGLSSYFQLFHLQKQESWPNHTTVKPCSVESWPSLEAPWWFTFTHGSSESVHSPQCKGLHLSILHWLLTHSRVFPATTCPTLNLF